ncbi:hypothetical protein BDZ85DRAFT_105648 [Elsinoe ampelina]|uniref:Uncharacterized protein n=1 Tax=Elsinoe ampelina TaxID=302913 RepID=A0A6A6FYT5_9PEZI|nr:hypothetical protein BDZ85DRAFT_105648 [Elsinoe ampelina]
MSRVLHELFPHCLTFLIPAVRGRSRDLDPTGEVRGKPLLWARCSLSADEGPTLPPLAARSKLDRDTASVPRIRWELYSGQKALVRRRAVACLAAGEMAGVNEYCAVSDVV